MSNTRPEAGAKKLGPFHVNVGKYSTQLGIVGILALVLGIFMIASPEVFLRRAIYEAFLTTVPFVGIMGLGLTLIVISKEIDLSFPSTMGFGGLAFATVFGATGSAVLGFFAALGGGALIGCANGVIIRKVGIPSIVVTVGMQFLVRGAVNVLSGGLAISLLPFRGNVLRDVLTARLFGSIPAQALWFAFLAIVLSLMLFRHRFGNHILAVGDNEDAANMMGINADKTKILVFVLMGVLAAFAGVVENARMLRWWPMMGEGYFLPTFAAVFIGGSSMFGGEGTMLGTFVGAFIIGSLEAGIIAAGLSGFWTRFFQGLLILLSVTVYTLLRKRRGAR